MPKLVDHEERRNQIALAVHRILLRDGMEGATVRAVVAEAGMSSGAIRHYFATQDELLRFAASQIEQRAGQRAIEAYARTDRSPRARALGVLEEFLPLDDERVMELKVSIAMARMDPALSRVQSYWSGIRRVCRTVVLLLAGVTSEVPVDRALRPAQWERVAERLHLIVDGLAAQQMFYGDQSSATELRAALARAVDDVRAEVG
ncbi:MAG: TetR/AcrR family transcriptional regulator [Propionibacteriales bacterium]|nr:TetR/AcrR family transcriptional regulator [Propionibacteriales bacterium]